MKIGSTLREVACRITVHGDGGVGKTTLAAGMPGVVFITSEDGLVNIASRAVEPAPTTWEETMSAVDFVSNDPSTKSVAIDSLDWLEPMCWSYTCRKARSPKIKAIEDFGYGKGYLAALDEWRLLLHKLSALRSKGLGVFLIAHSVATTFRNPEGDDYDRWQMKLHKGAAGLIKEWTDVLGFAQVEISTVEDKGRVKGMSTGRRVLRTDKTAAYDAKTRFHMPKSIPLDWPTLHKYIGGSNTEEAKRLLEEFESKLIELGDLAVEANARNYIGARGASIMALSEAIATLNTKLASKKEGSI